VKLPSHDENVNYALKLIEKLSSEKVQIPLTHETTKTINELQQSGSNLKPESLYE